MNAETAITHLVHLECQRVGKPWDPQGIFAAVRGAIEDDSRRPDQVVLAGLAAANDVNAKTPSAIRWATRYPETSAGAAVRLPTCEVCSKPEPACRAAAAKSGDPHEFTPSERAR